ncbi:MAG: pyridoxine 5'-phosphate synthase [Candidatus Omnitrophica bacterium]|nr:pyridoxine 5'-phosphate synthase [Candidatus Omnitrophota bacterium]
MAKLGVNIDHVATLRQARRETDPDPILAARICEEAGAHSIVAHLREDRRHIQDIDIVLLRKSIKIRFNLEMSISKDIVKVALQIKPDQATLVPERRQEVTTEGGLDVVGNRKRLVSVCDHLQQKGIMVSLFIDPDKKQIEATKALNVPMIELHTGAYARAYAGRSETKELAKLKAMTLYAQKLGLIVNAGHGLNYHNTAAVARIAGMEELNIGHSIISRAVFVGLKQAVKEMLQIIKF